MSALRKVPGCWTRRLQSLLWGVAIAGPLGSACWAQSMPPLANKPGTPAPAHRSAPPKPTPVVFARGSSHAQKPLPSEQPVRRLTPAPAVAASGPAPSAAEAAPPPAQDLSKGNETGLPLPRFVTLRFDDINLRAGPGIRYPIDWIYKRRDLPVEIEREVDVWRLVRDPDGIRGWVQKATLVARRSFIVTGADRVMRRDPRDDAAAVVILKLGVIGQLRSCEAKSAWCQEQVGDYRGWLTRDEFWGVLPDEVV